MRHIKEKAWIGFTILTVVIAAEGFVWYQHQVKPKNAEAAVQQAQRFEAYHSGTCLTVVTPARHLETGAEYTFSSSCMPEGWRATASLK